MVLSSRRASGTARTEVPRVVAPTAALYLAPWEGCSMSFQPPRFSARSEILRDVSISSTACRLYLLLDDESRDHWRLYEKQLRLAVMLGISTRQLRTCVGELARAGYITVKQTINGNVYDLERKKTSASDGKETSARSGRKLPVHLLKQESQESPQT